MALATIFGGTGYLGSRIARAFALDGWNVRLASRHPPVDDMPGHGVNAVVADVATGHGVTGALEGADCAVNAVSLYVERRGLTFTHVHVDGAGNLATACAEAGVAKLVHVSGIGADSGAADPYIAARGQGEDAVSAAFPGAVIMRPSALYGHGGGLLLALDGIAAKSPAVPLIGGGRTRLQPAHVDDVAKAVAVAAGSRTKPAGIYELGGADVLTLKEIVRRLLEATGRRRILLPLPFAACRALALIGERLPGAPLTRAQVELLATDNVQTPGTRGFGDLGIEPRGIAGAIDAMRTC